jgi:hypothetical protein
VIGAVLLGGVMGTVAFNDGVRRRHARLLREAIRLAGLTMTRASQEAELDQAQFTRQAEMHEGSLKRLAMLPSAFWQWYAVVLAAEFGMPIEAQRAAKLALASVGRKRMARAGAPRLETKAS